MRIIALDIGERRIGVALSDPLLILATPLTTIISKNLTADVETVIRLVCDNEATSILVGLPLSLDGNEGPQAKLTRNFINALENQSPVPINTFDERFSTSEAKKKLRDAGIDSRKAKGRVDAAAAAVILQRHLDSLGNT